MNIILRVPGPIRWWLKYPEMCKRRARSKTSSWTHGGTNGANGRKWGDPGQIRQNPRVQNRRVHCKKPSACKKRHFGYILEIHLTENKKGHRGVYFYSTLKVYHHLFQIEMSIL